MIFDWSDFLQAKEFYAHEEVNVVIFWRARELDGQGGMSSIKLIKGSHEEGIYSFLGERVSWVGKVYVIHEGVD